MATFTHASRIPAPPAVVFAWHERPGALVALTPPGARLRLAEGGDSLKPGSRTILELRIGGFPTRWVAEHVAYDPPRLFADRMVSGPFRIWEHRHWFLDDGCGGTVMKDEVAYELPMGAMGRWLGGAWARAELRRMFVHRHRVVRMAMQSHKIFIS